MNKRKKIITVFKYICLGFALATNGFILYQSALPAEESTGWQDWASDVWTDILNDKLDLKEKVEEVLPTDATFDFSSYENNTISGYQANEIPLGCVKQLFASVLPENATNKSFSFAASPKENANLVVSGNRVTIESLQLGDLTITATSNGKKDITKTFNFKVVDRVAPVSFDLTKNSFNIEKGKSELIGIVASETKLGNDQLKLARYYDLNNLEITSSNESVAAIQGRFIKAKEAGTATITVSNGNASKNIDVTVTSNSTTIIEPTDFSISGSDKVRILDVDNSISSQLEIDWGANNPTDKNVIWSVDKPLAAIINDKGEISGYRNLNPGGDVDFKVRATSVANPSLYKEMDMKLCQITPTSISIYTGLPTNDDGEYLLSNGQSDYVGISYQPGNVTKTGYVVNVDDNAVLQTNISGDAINVIGLKDGSATINVVSVFDNEIKSNTITIRVATRNIVNEDNSEEFSVLVRKYISGHAFLFMISAVFTALYVFFAHIDKKAKIMFPALASTSLIGFIFGCASEYMQTFVPGRSGKWKDVGIDLSGFAIGLALVIILALIYKLIINRKSRIKENEKK